MSEPLDRPFEDFASGHSFDFFKLPKHVADVGLKLEHVMFAVVPRAFWLLRFLGKGAYVTFVGLRMPLLRA
jgi:hypothetical protein